MTKPISSILNKKTHVIVTGSLWIECDGERYLVKGRVELLELIAETGSISKAARKMGMSYLFLRRTLLAFILLYTA